MPILRINIISTFTPSLIISPPPTRNRLSTPLLCSPILPQQPQGDDDGAAAVISCGPCSGRGWLVCDFCKGQKTNVKSETNRIYRRCPSCRAIGYVLCSSCKVYKCVSFPNYNDGEELSF